MLNVKNKQNNGFEKNNLIYPLTFCANTFNNMFIKIIIFHKHSYYPYCYFGNIE
ncbi:hypothetical protein BN1805_00204 [Proteus vulgaris]|nr:hypothetical protein BN1805_00204 [Proteus vulgaris]